ncbi:MAG: hypothetical protein EWV53_13125 [Microcystis panniformis Mp_MB_F_20051200_S9]|uniref:Uncharacterized protein n=1 Tax=Microcystis panniformis Mp_MB_F_20051200_S9 TaxID=2486223 RepID=A0A552PW54_9CHRO|nr:MAG: hypothetical protein EWV87_15725 [Microcystis panniformis Mp_GB_SS_20050300_S99]TRV47407.1 MAG: hypothetical protein EWV42_16415 [Microcystis panniformis Mp_GB_SS_20050300_S99D]TRV50399.1 MAG: hypothetical protein EWV43_06320 [Microcystis panniformis Mp_MB_F_20080800_S26D]TRV59130.1 MAG: hypothetical protein EWV86_18365 [Microcystis panniformis Mp_MB_F_20051200_S9D]TRV61203.1 MAG: hypothetical protein EWV53_13125 [Microcystis panniformis Mp_MB_F_20051200_S9]TRV64149.1 MAG: hypothetical
MGFLRGNFLLKSGVTFGFITQSKLLGGSTPQTPERISFSVGCLHAVVHIFVPISESLIIAGCWYFCKCEMHLD